MKLYNFNITKEINIPQEIIKNFNKDKTLIQVFSSQSINKLKEKLNKLNEIFKDAHIIGATTDGEIIDSKTTYKNTIISIAIFEDTTIKSFFSNEKDSKKNAEAIKKTIITPTTKAIIAFANGVMCNAENFIKNLAKDNNIIIAGGLSGYLNHFKKTYQIYKNSIIECGVVAASLNSTTLKVTQGYKLGWKPIGTTHIITSVTDNILHTIDDMKAKEFYKKYLGYIAENIPKIGVEFPLIKIDTPHQIRAPLYELEDGSLVFGGNFKKGEKIKLSVGDIYELINTKINPDEFECEGIFIYSCMARKRYMKNLAKKEIEVFKDCKNAGFFTYGEFFSNEFFNESLTFLALSEDNYKIKIPQLNIKPKTFCTTPFLINVINQIAREYEEKLQEDIKIISSNEQKLLKTLIKTANIFNQALIIYKKDTKKIVAYNNLAKKILKIKNKIKLEDILTSPLTNNYEKTYLLDTDKNKKKVLARKIEIEKFDVITFIDVEKLEEEEIKLMQQSKLAALGEMINMIAHQWRQPLTAISSTAIDLELKAMTNDLNPEYITKSAQKIEYLTQKMSKTINDFLKIARNESQKEEFNFDNLIEEIQNIISAQLKNHNIKLTLNNNLNKPLFTYKNELLHILLNLISNAKDAIIEKFDSGEIIINAYSKDNIIYIEVEDTGGGIPPEIIDKIFNAYFTTKLHKKGTGLGLYMSKKILIEKLKGDIKVENTKRGAKFTIMLPPPQVEEAQIKV